MTSVLLVVISAAPMQAARTVEGLILVRAFSTTSLDSAVAWGTPDSDFKAKGTKTGNSFGNMGEFLSLLKIDNTCSVRVFRT
jgi:hypothetical protein